MLMLRVRSVAERVEAKQPFKNVLIAEYIASFAVSAPNFYARPVGLLVV